MRKTTCVGFFYILFKCLYLSEIIDLRIMYVYLQMQLGSTLSIWISRYFFLIGITESRDYDCIFKYTQALSKSSVHAVLMCMNLEFATLMCMYLTHRTYGESTG